MAGNKTKSMCRICEITTSDLLKHLQEEHEPQYKRYILRQCPLCETGKLVEDNDLEKCNSCGYSVKEALKSFYQVMGLSEPGT